MKRKFIRKINLDEFATLANQKTHLDPHRALKTLKRLQKRAVVVDARHGEVPAVISVLEQQALNDAIRLFGVRLQMMYDTERAS